MATVLIGGGDVFDSLLYHGVDQGTVQFLNTHNQGFNNLLNSAASSFFSYVSPVFERFNHSDAIRLAHAAMRKVSTAWQSDGIALLSQIGHFQHASLEMQRWIMAEPTTRALYHTQGCDGYSDTYVDKEPGLIAEQHYDYRRVMHGLYTERGDDYAAASYFEALRPNDRELMLVEQSDILETWGNLRHFIQKRGDDPTSKFNASL